jgi:D123.
MEFRCFVSHHNLVGICQRNHAEYYPHLPKECNKIKRLIVEFFTVYIQHYFANGKIADYVFDVYVDKNDCVWLIDFNLWSTRTDALMFTWEELLEMASCSTTSVDQEGNKHDKEDNEIVMRVVMNENDIRFDPLASYRAPIDTVALAKDPKGEGLQSFEDFMAMCAKPSDLVSDDEDDA